MSAIIVAAAGSAIIGGISSSSSASKGLDAQKDQNEANEKFIKEQAAKSRKDVIPLFNASQDNLVMGSQGALDIFQQTIPLQAETFTEGNVRAQEQLLAGLPQIQNALMGLPVDLTGLQAQRIPVNTSFANAKMPKWNLPDATYPNGKKAKPTPEQQAAIARSLAGKGGF